MSLPGMSTCSALWSGNTQTSRTRPSSPGAALFAIANRDAQLSLDLAVGQASQTGEAAEA